MPTRKQVKDIEQLADFMDVLPDENLDMDRYLPYRWEDEDGEIIPWVKEVPFNNLQSPTKEIECKTSCCLAGWAAVLFQDRWNFSLGIEHSQFARFLGITETQGAILCAPSAITTPQVKAAQLRELIKE